MEVTLKPNNRKAKIISGINDDLVKVRVEDGRELVWPISKINMPPKEGEDTLKMVVVPAIDRLRELRKDASDLASLDILLPMEGRLLELNEELKAECLNDFKNKWGLCDTEERGHSTNEGVKYTLP